MLKYKLYYRYFLLIIVAFSGQCLASQYRCANERCIPASYVNDGDNDCGDMSDESNREYSQGGFTELFKEVSRSDRNHGYFP